MAEQTLTVFPEQLAEMSVSQLANLTHAQKCEVDINLTQASAWLKQARAKFDTALEQCYGDKARAALLESGRDFGTAHIADGHLEITLELPKRVSWDQKKLAEIADRIAAAGDRVQDYMDIDFSVSESRYTNWPPALRVQFSAARTVKSGKATFRLSLNHEEGV
ncbi:MAG: hypothetical protein GZ093_11005 [Rhodoferax sp.]|uniref:hypothetical protein n=1 Tax=Rhodoferax sp. TaxID=50421 RepID=UPI0013FF512E|nr:hypothetical protein [Rhodoferax sp.]NDP39261.1 hypothetical protein [Rhodoferax sp.]